MDGIDKNPAIRFAGFSDIWEEDKLGELSDVYDGTHQTPNYTDNGVMFLSVENIKTLQSEKYISREDFEKEFKVFPKKGDILMTRIGDIGTANVIESNDPKAYYVSLALLKKKKLNPYFLKESISSKTVKKELWHRTLHIAFPKKINKNEISNIAIPYPKSEEEQQKIGELFKQLDNLITLHQHKYDKLVIIKKSMLEKMFPKAGANVPEIRFAGFADAWEQRKLIELITPVVREIPKPMEPYEKISVRSHAKGTFRQKIENPDAVSMDKLFVVRENDLIVNITFAWEHAIAVATKEDDGLLVSHRFPTYTMSNSDVGFMKYIVSQENFRKKMELISPGGAGRNRVLDKKEFLSIEVSAPNEIDEQNRIGVFFMNLDKLINLHQRELERLKNIKQSLLEKMFV